MLVHETRMGRMLITLSLLGLDEFMIQQEPNAVEPSDKTYTFFFEEDIKFSYLNEAGQPETFYSTEKDLYAFYHLLLSIWINETFLDNVEANLKEIFASLASAPVGEMFK